MKTFIEIGSCDFQTLNYLSDFGWKGVIVEPVKKYLDNIEQKPNVFYVNAAVDTDRGSRELWLCSEELVDSDKDYAGMSSFYKNVQSEKAGSHDRSIIVPTLTYSDLISMCNITQVDYLKIDTEGHDYEILKMVDLRGPLRPKYIKIEHKHSSFDAIVGHLSTNGYHCEVWPWDIIAIDVLQN